jgi:hypothetical protein
MLITSIVLRNVKYLYQLALNTDNMIKIGSVVLKVVKILQN